MHPANLRARTPGITCTHLRAQKSFLNKLLTQKEKKKKREEQVTHTHTRARRARAHSAQKVQITLDMCSTYLSYYPRLWAGECGNGYRFLLLIDSASIYVC